MPRRHRFRYRRRRKKRSVTKFVLVDWWAKPLIYVTKATVLTTGAMAKGTIKPWK